MTLTPKQFLQKLHYIAATATDKAQLKVGVRELCRGLAEITQSDIEELENERDQEANYSQNARVVLSA